MGRVKTTLELPDDLMRAVKVRAAQEGRRLKDVMTEVMRLGLAHEPNPASRIRHRVRLPLIEGGHPARRDAEMTPQRIHEILLQQEVEVALEQS
jgi:plasmid stability protein